MKKIIYYNNQQTNYSVNNLGQIFNEITNRELKGSISCGDYRRVQLTIDEKIKSFFGSQAGCRKFL